MRSNVKDLEGITVVALEQAVAAPYASSRLADAGARVIKIERAEGDFARRYDSLVNGDSAYFVWLNRGKQSIASTHSAVSSLLLLLTVGEPSLMWARTQKIFRASRENFWPPL